MSTEPQKSNGWQTLFLVGLIFRLYKNYFSERLKVTLWIVLYLCINFSTYYALLMIICTYYDDHIVLDSQLYAYCFLYTNISVDYSILFSMCVVHRWFLGSWAITPTARAFTISRKSYLLSATALALIHFSVD